MQQQTERTVDIEQFLQHLSRQESAAHEAEMPWEEPPQPNIQPEAEEDVQETIHVYFVREEEAAHKDVRIVESTPPISPQRKSDLPAYTTILFYIFLIFSCLALQLYLVFNPQTASVTLVPRSQTVTLAATVQLGRLLNPLTLRQSQTVPTTGTGHQDAKLAQGTITFYNGQFASVFVPAGTILTGARGIRIITNQDVTIPSANPPVFGQATIAAHAIQPGRTGNIPAYDISVACCAASVLAKNINPFIGGQDARDFSTVRKQDIHMPAAQLISTINLSMQEALLGQLSPLEQLQLLPCRPTVNPDHPVGAEATHVTVDVSETCSAAAYTSGELVNRATDLLTRRAEPKVKTGYRLQGAVRVSVLQASLTSAAHPLVFLSVKASATWTYALTQSVQQQIKTRIAGRTKQEALQLLKSLPGIESAEVRWGDDSKLPKNPGYIHLTLIVPL
jgi:hypothetical protein